MKTRLMKVVLCFICVMSLSAGSALAVALPTQVELGVFANHDGYYLELCIEGTDSITDITSDPGPEIDFYSGGGMYYIDVSSDPIATWADFISAVNGSLDLSVTHAGGVSSYTIDLALPTANIFTGLTGPTIAGGDPQTIDPNGAILNWTAAGYTPDMVFVEAYVWDATGSPVADVEDEYENTFPTSYDLDLTGETWAAGEFLVGYDVEDPSILAYVTGVTLNSGTDFFDLPNAEYLGYYSMEDEIIIVPEPLSMTLLAAGAVALLRRKK